MWLYLEGAVSNIIEIINSFGEEFLKHYKEFEPENKISLAYLDNFEYLEADIEIVDVDLLHTMEVNMREELRTMVKEKRTPEEIAVFINDIGS